MPLLAGCGSDAAAVEPFAGTWRDLGTPEDVWSPPLIIAKAEDGYRATMAFSETHSEFTLTRQGDKLLGTIDLAMGPVDVEIVYLPASGNLTFSNATSPGGPMSEPVEMTRVSDSTAVPTVSPF